MRGRRRSPGRRSRMIFWRRFGRGCNEGTPIINAMATGRERRRAERVPTASIPVQLSDINSKRIDLSLTGAAVVHRSPIKAGTACTLIFPSYGGIYIPCEIIRSAWQVRGGAKGPEDG